MCIGRSVRIYVYEERRREKSEGKGKIENREESKKGSDKAKQVWGH